MADIGGPSTGTAGNDFLMGDARDLGGGSVDNYSNSGTFALLGLGGDDVIVGDLFDITGYNTEGDELRGGDGNDTIYGDTAPDLSAFGISSPWVGDPDWDTRVLGSADSLYGDAGNDTVYGGGGGDQIYGGTGNDMLYGQMGGDTIYGEDGRDTIVCGGDNDTTYGGAGIDTISGGAGNDSLYGEAFSSSLGDLGDVINGGSGNDDIRGGAGADTLSGDAGDDQITGGGLSSDGSNDRGDICLGGTGDDMIDGRYGNDKITGGGDLDTLTGGDGNDLFIYLALSDSRGTSVDIITDFNASATDRIDLSAIDAIPGGADDDFTFRGSSAFNGAGQIRIVTDTVNFHTFIKISTDADSAAEMTIQLNGLITLDKTDFIL